MNRDSVKLIVSVVSALLAVAVFGVLLSVAPELANPSPPTPTPGGISIVESKTPAPVQLIDQDGVPKSLSNFEGKYVYLLFAFTNCPDVCPTGLSDMKQVQSKLGEKSEEVRFVMITVDPERDTAERLKTYLSVFDSSFIGLTGSMENIRRIANRFDVFFEKQQPKKDEAGYDVVHSAFTYLLDRDGRWVRKYPYQTPSEIVVNDIRQRLASR
jgi:protein SCO1/2